MSISVYFAYKELEIKKIIQYLPEQSITKQKEASLKAARDIVSTLSNGPSIQGYKINNTADTQNKLRDLYKQMGL